MLIKWFGIEACFLSRTVGKLLLLIFTFSARLKCQAAKHINITRGSYYTMVFEYRCSILGDAGTFLYAGLRIQRSGFVFVWGSSLSCIF